MMHSVCRSFCNSYLQLNAAFWVARWSIFVYILSVISFTVWTLSNRSDRRRLHVAVWLQALYGWRPKSVSSGLSCDLNWTVALSVTHSTAEAECAACYISEPYLYPLFFTLSRYNKRVQCHHSGSSWMKLRPYGAL